MKRGREFFTLREAAETHGFGYYPEKLADTRIPQIFRADSRVVERGGGFIAIKGAMEDGHDYIAQAVKNGAVCVICEKSFFESHKDELSAQETAFILTDVVGESVVKLAKTWFNMVSPKVAGITGSVGKTTTREFLHTALRGTYRTHAAVKSYNTLLGVSMTVLAMPGDIEILILELGTNHPGEIREIVNHFPVTYGIITEVSEAHLEGLGNIEGVLAAKMELIESRKLEFLSYNSDNDLLFSAVARMSQGEKMKKGGVAQVGVGYSNSGVRISDVRQTIGPDFVPALYVTLSMKERKTSCRSPIFGKQHAKNIAFAYSVSVQAGLDDRSFERAAERFELSPGRGLIFPGKNGVAIIDETYNASPASLSYAVKNLLEMELPDDFARIAILGGMRELGHESPRLHEIVLSRVALLDGVYLIGSEWGAALPKGEVVRGIWPDVGRFISEFDFESVKNSVFLLKGSRFYGLERLLPLFTGEIGE
ncbi:MAG: UDP-N-acetylmuramoyl-tripeptide--D-alanyl-D-alanine ligase [Synergistaceae bacterium]|jgi:UDP-N-acetylmuramoyl-tripeptide--D-alanyl-D-alanine ligase|nr:UDP-N-acetylmuramoyl-tripeptide--D-alanyl-D-alanine ligase [Synergistaceae bacterium]